MRNAVRTSYRAIAVLLLNTLLMFVLLNFALGGFFYVRDRSKGRLPQPLGSLKYPKEHLAQVYPHMREEEWTALLTETWTLSYEFEPFTHFRESPLTGRYVNVSENGFRMNRRQGPWPPTPHAFNIFFFGGSTTFGYGVRDDETIPSVLQDLLSQQACATPVYVYNFGRAAYYSSQEQILFARLLVEGFTPQLAVFLDGFNELFGFNELLADADQHRRLQEPRGPAKPDKLFSMRLEMPLFRATRGARARVERILAPNPPRSSAARQQPDPEAQKVTLARTVLPRYLQNKAFTEAIAARFGIETLFVWQPAPVYGYDLQYHLFPPLKARIEPPRYAYSEFNKIRARLPERDQRRLLWLGDLQHNKKEPLYVDEAHYTAAFSREIAEQIAKALVSRNLACPGAASTTQRK